MRVFVLCTGRCGSKVLTKALNHIANYTVGHETNSKQLGETRLIYPDNHIEIDNRLAWFLGRMDSLYGKDSFYIHLTRNPKEVALSYRDRWKLENGMVKMYWHGVHMKSQRLRGGRALEACEDMITTVTSNIDHFLKDKPLKMNFPIEKTQELLPVLWKNINAQGNIKKALAELSEGRKNSTYCLDNYDETM